MQKSRLLILVIVGLLASNLLLAGYIIAARNNGQASGRPEGAPPHGGPRNLIIERLKLNEQQVAKYDELIQWHRGNVDRLDEQIRQLKNELYSTLNQQQDERKRDSLIEEIIKQQQEIEHIHYKHFEDIKELCTEQQQPAFAELTKEIAALFGRPPHKRPRP